LDRIEATLAMAAGALIEQITTIYCASAQDEDPLLEKALGNVAAETVQGGIKFNCRVGKS
jgi:hypothetical protein